jgi:hypothetical protein
MTTTTAIAVARPPGRRARVTGLWSAVLLLAQVTLMARMPVLEHADSQDRLAGLHRIVGLVSFDLMAAHGGDMVCRVADPARPAWRVGIEDPHDLARVVAVMLVRDGAVATSGLAHRGGHVVDARTGRVQRALASVSVVAADLVTADIDATAAFALGADGPAWLAGRGDRTGVVVHADGRVQLVSP